MKPQPRRVQLIHKAIAYNAAAGDMQAAHKAWDMAPVRYRGVMSLCMWVGRLKACKPQQVSQAEPGGDRALLRGGMIVHQDSVKGALC